MMVLWVWMSDVSIKNKGHEALFQRRETRPGFPSEVKENFGEL